MTNKDNYILIELANLNPPQTEFNNKAVKRALELLGNPQENYKVLHLAGTNGKGSTASFIEAGLLKAGYNVGKYTSPYIHILNECIVLNEQQISDKELIELYLELKEKLITAQIYLSSFEMLTVIMFVYFAYQKIDYLVLETGMGGLDDATNVVDNKISVITNISLEHTQWLGNTLSEIARHKAGIIGTGPVIIADNTLELINAVKARAMNYTNVLDKYDYKTKLDTKNFTTDVWFARHGLSNLAKVKLGLFGHFQALNFLLAYEVLALLKVNAEIIFAAALEVKWSGRLQLISAYPKILADASHNASGVSKLYQSLRNVIKPDDCVLIVSILADKDHLRMLDYYSRISSTIIVCGLPLNPRALSPFKLAKLANHKFKEVHICNSPEDALKKAKKLGKKLIVISGSTYLLKHFI